jgi:hypothetical protein
MVTDPDNWDAPPIGDDPWLVEQPLHGECAATPSYAALKGRIKRAGILNGQPVYYAYKIVLTLGLLAAGGLVLARCPPFELQLLDAAFLAFVFT